MAHLVIHDSKDILAVFFSLWFFIVAVFIILYVLYFLLKLSWKRSKVRNKAKKYIFLVLTDQLLISSFAYLLLKERAKNSALIIVLNIFVLNFLNAFFIHYFFSKPVMEVLHKKYPYYFPRHFDKKTWLIMKVDNLKFKGKKSSSWPIILTLIFVNFQIFFLLFIVKNYKTT